MIELANGGLSNETWNLVSIGLGMLVTGTALAVFYLIPRPQKEKR